MINSVAEEVEKVVKAHPGKIDFTYGRVSEINESSKKFPHILLDHNPDVADTGFSKVTNLPNKKEYTVRMIAFDTFKKDDNLTETSLSDRQRDVELFLDQVLGELIKRGKNDPALGLTWEVEREGFHGYPVHNAKLVQVAKTVKVTVRGDCETVEFNYG